MSHGQGGRLAGWRQAAILWPLARRGVAVAKRRNALLAAMVGLSLVFYCLYMSFLDLTYREAAQLAHPTSLPAPVILVYPDGLTPADEAAIRSLYWLDASLPVVLGPAATSAGVVDVMVVSDAAPVPELGTLTRGMEPGPGECLLPVGMAAAIGLDLGGELTLMTLRQPGGAGLEHLPPAATVSGLFEPRADWLAVPLVVVPEADFAQVGGPTMVLMWVAHPETFEARAVRWLKNRLTPTDVGMVYRAQRALMPLVMLRDTPGELMRGMARAIYLPGGGAMFLLYVFFGLGAFALMLLGFLQRRRQLAVMKTLGLTSRQAALVLYMEVLIVAAGGLVLGFAVLAGSMAPLRLVTGKEYVLSPWIMATGSIFSLLALLVSVWFPIVLARLASVAVLLGGQPLRVAGYERRWGAHADERDGRDRTWSDPV